MEPMKTLAKLVPFLIAAATLAGCNSGGRCTHKYTMQGVSQGNATLYNSAGNAVQSIDIQTPEPTCPAVNIELKHLDSQAKLVAPAATDCVSAVTGNETSKVTFDHKVKCGCDDGWDWTVTNVTPPVKFHVRVRPTASCGN